MGGLHAKAQHKESWRIHIAAGISSNTSPLLNIKKSNNSFTAGTGLILTDSSGAPFFRTDGYQQVQNNITYKAATGSSFAAGVQYSFPVYKKWYLGIAVDLALTRLNRTSTNESVKFINFNSIVRNDTIFSTTGNSLTYLGTVSTLNQFPTKRESFSFVTLDIPVTIGYSFKKINLAAGINTSLLVSSVKAKTNQQQNPEIVYEEPAYINNQRMALALSLCPSYQLTPKLQLGINYQHGVTSLNDARNYRPLKARLSTITLAYKL